MNINFNTVNKDILENNNEIYFSRYLLDDYGDFNTLKSNSTQNNVSYCDTILYPDGTKGTIYNIERSNCKIKIYYSGDKDDLANLSSFTIRDENNTNITTSVITPIESNKYILEFNDLNKNSAASLVCYNNNFKLEDSYKINS